MVTNPTFTSQTKEFLSSKPSTFGSTCELSEDFLKAAMKVRYNIKLYVYTGFNVKHPQNQ